MHRAETIYVPGNEFHTGLIIPSVVFTYTVPWLRIRGNALRDCGGALHFYFV